MVAPHSPFEVALAGHAGLYSGNKEAPLLGDALAANGAHFGASLDVSLALAPGMLGQGIVAQLLLTLGSQVGEVAHAVRTGSVAASTSTRPLDSVAVQRKRYVAPAIPP